MSASVDDAPVEVDGGGRRKAKLLLVDDETGILETLRILFRGEGCFEVFTESRGEDAIRFIEDERPDIVLSDIRMPGSTGIDVLAAARRVDPEIAVILMTAQASLQSAMQAVNEGAYYYLQKPFQNEELLAIVRRAAEARELRVENRELKKLIRTRDAGRTSRPVGRARSFIEVIELAETVAPTDSTVLLSGESGSGKEVVARYIHTLSDRAEGAFYSVNCGALPESLLESELFGHVEGAFTGAVRDKDGLLVAANGGTLFLDEIGEMTPATQVKLLRVLQEREVIPVGSTKRVPVDVRVIAATNRELEEEIRRGNFRRDLYYRLNVIALHLPPLRDRRDDIPLLLDYFLDAWCSDEGVRPEVTDEAMRVLSGYDWPGNVRELENAIERAVVVARGRAIGPAHLPDRVREAPRPHLVESEIPPNPTMEVIERAYIRWVLDAEGGNKTRAAEVLGIDPSTLYRKLNRYGIDI
ncbi:MAG: sigma-54 dependent transcriptional regulator [Longimicrobiales bacterium]|nr:sigma-54 dependent transcriptional regulator [Longimicrobiales bacterium]